MNQRARFWSLLGIGFRLRLLPAAALAFGTLLLLTGTAHAEVKVVDANGLTRAVHQCQGKAEVEVTLMKAPEVESPAPVLVNVDGIGADITGSRVAPDRYRFAGVGEGTWRVDAKGSPIRQVKVSGQ